MIITSPVSRIVVKYPAALWWFACTFMLATVGGCDGANNGPAGTGADKKPVIGVAFETLQTEFWVAGHAAIKAECEKRGYDVVEAIADGDANRQLQQVKNLITRGVNGIILVPKDTKTCGPMIRAANDANIPIVLFNRPASSTELKTVAVVADNFTLSKQTGEYLIQQAKSFDKPVKAMILIGDLADSNAIQRRDGFETAVNEANATGAEIEIVARIPTEWNQEKAQAGVVNALTATPDIRLIFTSSDFLLPSIVSALQAVGKYHPTGKPGHIILGGFDGDATAYQMLKDGYLDATGVQDVYFEAEKCVQTIADLRASKKVDSTIPDPGFVIHQQNLDQRKAQMWGAQVSQK